LLSVYFISTLTTDISEKEHISTQFRLFFLLFPNQKSKLVHQ